MRTALRDSVRAWKRSPVVAGVAVLSLALGIGATTTFFSIVERLLLRTLEVHEPHQLAVLSADGPAEASRFTYPVWEQIRARDQLYEGAFAWWPWSVNLAPRGEVEMVQAVFASGGVFRTLWVDTVIGRPFDEKDDVRGGGPDGRVAVISYGLWQRRFGGTADVIGRTLSVERVPFTIVGVAPRSLPGLAVGTSFDVVLPLLSEPAVRPDFSSVDAGRVAFLRIVMRLPPSRSLEAVTASLRADQAAIRDATIAPFRRHGDRGTFLASPFAVVPGAAGSTGAATYYAQSATVALGIGTLLLLACCGNVATVLLAHGARRHFELSVRVALGATRWQAGRQLLVDSLLLATAGAAAGLALSWWAGPWLVAQWDDAGLTRSMPAALNWRGGAFAAATGLITGVLCGLTAAWRATRIGPADSLKARGPRHSSEAVQRGFVVAQLAFSVVVIVTSSLLLRSYDAILSAPALARLDGVMAVELRLARSAVPPAARPAVVDRVQTALAAFPGVVSSLAMTVPFYGGAYFWAIEPIDHEGLGEPNRMALVNAVSSSHFDAVGVGVVAGRRFDGRDVATSPRVGVANQTFARKYLGGDQRVPQRVRTGTGKGVRQIEIVGVVEDLPDTSLLSAPEPAMYLARNQDVVEDGVVFVTVRPRSGGIVDTAAIAAAIAGAAPEVSLRLVPLALTARSEFTRERMLAIVAGFFVALATLIAALGVFGVVSFGVTARRRELGIRLALGALPRQVGTLILWSAGRLLLIGIAMGLLASWWATSFVSSLLVNTDAHHAGAFVATAGCLVILGLIAAWWPARQAARLDPAAVLRAD